MKKTKIDHYTDKEALDFHNSNKSGKIEIISSKPMITKRDLALAYSPGVAAPVRAISKNPDAAYDYTSKGNLVAVISNGSAVLGMGNLGALASKPVMEGKAVLFKRFADINSIDIEIDSSDPNEIVKSIKNIAVSFGGINLEDIAAPDCFVIEEKLKEINHEIGSSLNKRLIKSTDKAGFIIANSNFTKKLAIKVGINPSKIHVIFPGIQKPKIVENISKLKSEKIFGESFPKIITVARLDKRKGHDKILMLIKNLKPKFPKIKYISVGTGEEENSLVKLSKELSLEKEVIFLKNIDHDLKIALIAEANLFLMPTRIEKKSVVGFCISFVEAASYGVASIGGKDGGASDAITHNKTGLICDGKDLNSIYDSVINFFQNEKFIQYGKDAKKFSENFHWNIVIKNYLKLIN